jgi:serine protease Do
LSLKPGDDLYLVAADHAAPSRVVKWETSYKGKVLPVALMRVHHPGEGPPLPGAPLFNAAGELVAICHQPAPQFGNGTFALPVEVVARVEADLKALGRVTSCWIGITVNASDPVLAIEMVRPGSPGAEAGLRKGDILLAIGPREVRTYAEARNAFYFLVAGQATSLRVLRGTQRLDLKVIPEVHPSLELPGDRGEEGAP